MEGGAPARGTQFTTQFTCFTSTKVQILTPEELRARRKAEVMQQGTAVAEIKEGLEEERRRELTHPDTGIYICIHIHTYIHAYVYTHIHTYTRTHIHTCIHI